MSSWMSAAKGRLSQILVAVDAGIDQKVYVVGLSARSLQTGLGRRDRQMQCAVTGAPTCSVTSTRSITVPIAAHQILVHGEENDADLQT